MTSFNKFLNKTFRRLFWGEHLREMSENCRWKFEANNWKMTHYIERSSSIVEILFNVPIKDDQKSSKSLVMNYSLFPVYMNPSNKSPRAVTRRGSHVGWQKHTRDRTRITQKIRTFDGRWMGGWSLCLVHLASQRTWIVLIIFFSFYNWNKRIFNEPK